MVALRQTRRPPLQLISSETHGLLGADLELVIYVIDLINLSRI